MWACFWSDCLMWGRPESPPTESLWPNPRGQILLPARLGLDEMALPLELFAWFHCWLVRETQLNIWFLGFFQRHWVCFAIAGPAAAATWGLHMSWVPQTLCQSHRHKLGCFTPNESEALAPALLPSLSGCDTGNNVPAAKVLPVEQEHGIYSSSESSLPG